MSVNLLHSRRSFYLEHSGNVRPSIQVLRVPNIRQCR